MSIVQEIANVASPLALVWAIWSYLNNKNIDKCSMYKEKLSELPVQFNKISNGFENQAINFTRIIFDEKNEGYDAFFKIMTTALEFESYIDCNSYLHSKKGEIQNYMAFSIPTKDIDISISHAVEMEKHLASINGFSPSSYQLIRSAGEYILEIYKLTFSLSTLTELMISNIAGISECRGEKFFDKDLIRTNYLLTLCMVSPSVKYSDLFAKIDLIIKDYVNYISGLSNRKLMKLHNQNSNIGLELRGKKKTHTIINCLEYEGDLLGVDLNKLKLILSSLD